MHYHGKIKSCTKCFIVNNCDKTFYFHACTLYMYIIIHKHTRTCSLFRLFVIVTSYFDICIFSNCQKTHWSLHKLHCKATPDPVGHPFILSIPESRATFSRLCTMMEAYSRSVRFCCDMMVIGHPDPGHPFILSIPESRATFSRLCTMMEAYSRSVRFLYHNSAGNLTWRSLVINTTFLPPLKKEGHLA